MIYRKRLKKSGYSFKLLPNNIKIELGKRVWYFPFLGVKPLHTLRSIKDIQGTEQVTHARRRERVTIDRDTKQDLTLIARAFSDFINTEKSTNLSH